MLMNSIAKVREFSALSENGYSADTEDDLGVNILPIVNEDETGCYLGVALARTVTSESKPHVVVVAYTQTSPTESGYMVWCGDTYLEGRDGKKLLATEKREKAMDFFRTLHPDTTTLALANVDTALRDSFNTAGIKSTGCNFWTVYRKSGGDKGCKHCAFVLSRIADEELTSLQATYNELAQNPDVGTASASSSMFFDADGTPLDAIDMMLEEDAGRVPLMLIGSAGGGKTERTKNYAARHNLPYYCIGGNSDTRPVDFTGHWVPTKDGFVWKDGKFTEAIRRAQTERVVLNIDEIYRIPTEHQSALLTTLSPHGRKYSHETGRMLPGDTEGIGKCETISCPVENLALFATTNLGVEYGILNRDPAIRRRFREIEVETTEDTVRSITTKVLKQRGFNVSLSEGFAKLWIQMRKARDDGMLAYEPNVAIFCRCIDLAKNQADIPRQLLSEALQWIGTTLDGRPNEDHLTTVKRAVASFKV